ncbi:unnamed protein product [Pleuronectes platessa]|uniref:Uncharacterized protein n=1 Tax=Pleuronectes platessa TaxID=8262 RepID=A0A9N7W5T5_PLEPL|nr:unnamed protein product [Pleuronectes platessa]
MEKLVEGMTHTKFISSKDTEEAEQRQSTWALGGESGLVGKLAGKHGGDMVDLDQWEGHLGFQMSRAGIYGGISQLALAPTVTFILQSGMSEPAASCQLPIYPHISE